MAFKLIFIFAMFRRNLLLGLVLLCGVIDAHAALSIQELVKNGPGRPQSRQPATQTKTQPSAGTRGPASVDLGMYEGPARWGGDTVYPDNLRRQLYASGPTYGGTAKAAFARYVLVSAEMRAYVFYDFKAMQRVDAKLNSCSYGNPDDALGGKLVVSFWPVGERKGLTAEMMAKYQSNSSGVADVEVQSCPANLPAALVLGFGEKFFDVVERLAMDQLPTPYCESEIAAETARKDLSARERSLLDWYKTFNSSGRVSVGTAVATAHLLPNAHARQGGTLVVDRSPVAACIARTLADGNHEAGIAPLAQEGYAIRLMEGSGVAKNMPLAIEYLEHAAKRWHYGSASMRLARIYLSEQAGARNLKLATEWLRRAAIDAPDTPVGSPVSPDDAATQLFDIYLSGQHAAKDFAGAESLYYAIRSQPRQKDLLATVVPRIPGLKKKLDEEELLSARAREAQAAVQADRKFEAWSRCVENNPENSILRCGRSSEQYRGLY